MKRGLIAFLALLAFLALIFPLTPSAQLGGPGYKVIEDEGTPLTRYRIVDMVGTIVTCANDTGQTTCTIDGSLINDETFGDGTEASMVWTFDPSGATANPTITVADDSMTFSHFTCTNCIGTAEVDMTASYTWTGTNKYQTGTLFVPDGDQAPAFTCGASDQGNLEVSSYVIHYCSTEATPAERYTALGNILGQSTDLACDSCVASTELWDATDGHDIIAFWDDGDSAWETRDPTSDFPDDGTNFRLNSNVSEHGTSVGDAQDEVYNSDSCSLVSATGEACIDNDGHTWVYRSTGQTNTLYPERQSFVACGASGGVITDAGVFHGPFANYFTVGTEGQSTNLIPVALSCDEMTVCFPGPLTDSTEAVTVTLQKATGVGSFADTNLACTVTGAASGDSVCNGTASRISCADSESGGVSFSQYDRATVELDCNGAGCPTISQVGVMICFRCWTDE